MESSEISEIMDLDSIGYVFDTSDGVEVMKSNVIIKKRAPYQVHSAFTIGTDDDKFCLVVIPANGDVPAWSYHADTDKPREALKLAIKASRMQKKSQKEHRNFTDQISLWLKNTNRPFTKQDAQNAGFCRLGVEQVWNTLGFGSFVHAVDVLKNMSNPLVSRVAYSTWKQEYRAPC